MVNTILAGDYTDGDENTYDAVVIGEQLWTVENLYTTKYQNGTNIPNVTDNSTWAGLTTGAYCWYNNDYTTYGQYYGALYNWYAINGEIDLRIPTAEEWEEERLTWGTNNLAGGFNSNLKLTAGGYKDSTSGNLKLVNAYGNYWSSSVDDGTNSKYLLIYSSNASTTSYRRARGKSVRLIKNGTYTQTEFDSISSDTISIDGISYGYCYNSNTGKIWLNKNLGASRVATSATDSDSYGYLYQWGRINDGHELRTSSITSALSTSDFPGHSYFIVAPNFPYNWRSPQNYMLWQSPSKLIDNNGYRVPSDSDWTQLTDYLINENWCNGVVVTKYDIAQFLKSCSQVNHPLSPNTL